MDSNNNSNIQNTDKVGKLPSSDLVACYKHILRQGDETAVNDMVNLCRNKGFEASDINGMIEIYTFLQGGKLKEGIERDANKIAPDNGITCDVIKSKYSINNMCLICDSISHDNGTLTLDSKTENIEKDIIHYLLHTKIVDIEKGLYSRELAKSKEINSKFVYCENINPQDNGYEDLFPIYKSIHMELNREINKAVKAKTVNTTLVELKPLTESTHQQKDRNGNIKTLNIEETGIYLNWRMANQLHLDAELQNPIVRELLNRLYKEKFTDTPQKKEARQEFLGTEKKKEKKRRSGEEQQNFEKPDASGNEQKEEKATLKKTDAQDEPVQYSFEDINKFKEEQNKAYLEAINEIKEKAAVLSEEIERLPIPTFSRATLEKLGYIDKNKARENDLDQLSFRAKRFMEGICLDVVHLKGEPDTYLLMRIGEERWITSVGAIKYLRSYIEIGRVYDEKGREAKAKIITSNIMSLWAVISKYISDIRLQIVQPLGLEYLAYIEKKGQDTSGIIYGNNYIGKNWEYVYHAYARSFKPGTAEERNIIFRNNLPIIVKPSYISPEGREIIRAMKIENGLEEDQWERVKYTIMFMLEYNGVLKGHFARLWNEDTEKRTLFFVVDRAKSRGLQTILERYTAKALKEVLVFNPKLAFTSVEMKKKTDSESTKPEEPISTEMSLDNIEEKEISSQQNAQKRQKEAENDNKGQNTNKSDGQQLQS